MTGRLNTEGRKGKDKTRNIVGSILIVLAVLYTVYLAVIMTRRIRAVVLKDGYVKVFRYELIACACFILFALDVRFGLPGRAASGVLPAGGWILRAAVIPVCAVMLFLLLRITVGSLIRSEKRAGYAIVLGLALENGKPTDDLVARLDTAERYIMENPDATLILTGGNPDESGKTEAAVMRDILLERGIPEGKMVLEDRAESTKQNFRNTAELVSPEEPVVLITSSYHMDRASRTAAGAGFKRILRRPAPSSMLLFGANVMWEAVLELNELTLKRE